MPEPRDPWTIHLRPRASMKPFTGAPWKPPPAYFLKLTGARDKPAPWFDRYQRMMNIGHRPSSAPAASVVRKESGNFIQTDLNPGVAFDKTTKKFRILLFEHGLATATGSFFTDEDGMVAYSGFHDFMGRGPHGIAGVTRSAGNMGPPGAALQAQHHWASNKGNKKRPTTALLKNKGYFQNSAADHNSLCERPDLEMRTVFVPDYLRRSLGTHSTMDSRHSKDRKALESSIMS
mmetsp:Transcript_48466/g.75679  ORF Transcript_48466/g.75679 Transcript_48466/m.75679 type:complete len:233 (-) Transcript_48466:560-1258(-)